MILFAAFTIGVVTILLITPPWSPTPEGCVVSTTPTQCWEAPKADEISALPLAPKQAWSSGLEEDESATSPALIKAQNNGLGYYGAT